MARLLCVLGILATCGPALAEQTLRIIRWPSAERRIESSAPGRHRVRLTTIERPGISRSAYAIRVHLRHEISGKAFFEMWSVWPSGRRFFSRTLAKQGPMRALTGSSASRWVVLPFTSRPGTPPPSRLELNLIFEGPGVVYLGPLELVQFAPGEQPLQAVGGWWGPPTGGWIGAAAGSLLGLWSLLLGWLTWRGRARRVVLSATAFLVVAALGLLAMGAIAAAMSQPYAVTYPLLLVGGIGTAVGVVTWFVARRRYRELELRRMRALDTGQEP